MQFSRPLLKKSADIFVATGQIVLSRWNKKNHSKTWKRSANAPCDFEISWLPHIQLLNLVVFQTPTNTAGKVKEKNAKAHVSMKRKYIFPLKTILGQGKGTNTTKTVQVCGYLCSCLVGKNSAALCPGKLVTFIQQLLFVLCSLPPSAWSLGCSAFPHFAHLNYLSIQGPFSHWNF